VGRNDWEVYRQLGWSVFPLQPKSKKPALVSWMPFKSRKPTEEEITLWSGQDYNIAVVTGEISGIIVIEADGPHDPLPSTWKVKTKKGVHYYFKHPGFTVPNSVRSLGPTLDVRGDGGYVAAPPSIHPDGPVYEWIEGRVGDFPPDVPDEWLEALRHPKAEPAWVGGARGVAEGKRDATATSIMGKLLSVFPSDTWDSIVWPAVVEWNKRNTPPLTERDLIRIYKSIASRQLSKGATESWRLPNGFTVKELMHMELKDTRWSVHGLLHEGLTILGGKPKIGKSLIAERLSIAIAAGIPMWQSNKLIELVENGGFQSEKGEVLYIDYENNKKVIRTRLHALASYLGVDDLDEVGQRIHVYDEWPRMDDGGLEHLDLWIERHPDVRLVVIDTLARIRPLRRDKDSILYMEDYHSLSPLQALANHYEISILLIHHANKRTDVDNPSDKLSGTTGMGGAAEATWIFERDTDSIQGSLTITSRQMEGKKLLLELREKYAWDLLGPEKAVRMQEDVNEIHTALAAGPQELMTLAKAMGRRPKALKRLLDYMVSRRIIDERGGLYQRGDAARAVEAPKE
jgi:hypothetical protein